jgi:hypothetical protein
MAARTQAVLYGVQQLLENELAAADFEITGNVVYRYAGGAWISVFYLDPDTETGCLLQPTTWISDFYLDPDTETGCLLQPTTLFLANGPQQT